MPTPEIGSPATVAINGEDVRVEVSGIDERHGIRVTNRQWGGQIDTWLPLTDLAAEN